ncbi:MAG: hypothetical protein OXC31_01440 [Spirochaetaceae bacterium]|nr:hypothetical protein [Spirochaetaceae bacterium]
MLNSPIVDVAMGLVFFYVTLSLVCSSIQEIIASLLGLRSRNLRKGIGNLIGSEYAEALYDHPLIKGLRKPRKLPSYIKPDIFSTALIDMISRDKADENAIDTATKDVRALIGKIDANNPTRELLISLVDKANPTVEDLRERLADWFDAGMDRVAGWYKRQVKYCLIGVAAAVTVAVNADSIRMVEQLWQDDALRVTIASAAEQAATKGDLAAVDERTALRAFPIGYPDSFPGISFRMIVGWLLTMAAISLGAPFWFDLLSKISHLRASGTREADRTKNST